MKLHANAALSLNKRRLLCQRVVELEWTVTKAAAARGQRPLRAQVGDALPRRR